MCVSARPTMNSLTSPSLLASTPYLYSCDHAYRSQVELFQSRSRYVTSRATDFALSPASHLEAATLASPFSVNSRQADMSVPGEYTQQVSPDETKEVPEQIGAIAVREDQVSLFTWLTPDTDRIVSVHRSSGFGSNSSSDHLKSQTLS